jgi:PadR family transcriptional regulator, regulatory protein PadR
MPSHTYLGDWEQTVLLATLRLGENAYGVPIRREIEERTKRRVSIGALYTTLDRLEAKGYLRSRMGDPTPERGGRSRRYFRVESLGLAALERSREALVTMWDGLDLKRART